MPHGRRLWETRSNCSKSQWSTVAPSREPSESSGTKTSSSEGSKRKFYAVPVRQLGQADT